MSVLLRASRSLRPLQPVVLSACITRPAAACASAPVRSFGAFHVPVGPDSNIDGVYRRPSMPVPTAPLAEDDEMIWDDDQAPEPVFDEFSEFDRWAALRRLTLALTVLFGGGLGLSWLSNPESKRVAAPQEYPFQSLRLSSGGPNGGIVKGGSSKDE